jgi:solute carrier family 25 folate transporter 32
VDRSSSSRFGSSLKIAREIALHEGGVPAFYRGLTPNLIGNSVSWGLYFLWYSNLKDAISVLRGNRKDGLTSVDFFVASGTAGKPLLLFTSLKAM